MKLSKTRRVIGIAGVALVMLGAVCGTLALTSHSTHAIGQVSASDIEKYKNNVLYKAFYTNLRSCYVTYMQGGINPSMDGKRSPFNSTTYFTDTGNVLEFPWKFGTGSTTTASCPNMITGWKTSWPASWFTDRGDFSGIKTDIELPGEFGVDDVTKMGEFLTKIGYREESSADGDLSGRKCFYLSANLTQKVRDEYGIYGENRTFETVDFCVKVDDKGLVQPTEDAFVALTGINEYGFCGSNDDSGRLTDSSNIIFVGFNTNTGCTPQFTMNLNNLMFLNANVTEVIPRWNGSSMNYTIQIQQPTSDNCQSLGYEICTRLKGLTIGSVTFEGSLAGGLVMFGGVPVATAYDTIQSRLVSVFRGMKDKYGDDVFDNVRVHDYDPKTYSYIKQLDSRGVSTFLKAFLSNPSSYKNGDFTDAEKYVLYWTYLKDYYKVLTRSDEPVGSTSYKVKWLNDDGTFTDTYIYNPQANSTALRNVLSTTTYGELSGLDSITAWSNTKKDWEWIAQQLATIDTDKAFSEEITEIEDPTNPTEDPDDPNADDTNKLTACYDGGGPLGWIMCPVLQLVGGATNYIYDNLISPALEIKASKIFDRTDGVYLGWSTFRNFADILFGLMFMLVIYSQLTGFGLDNYGIKKILPRLIMVAVLVNISYILCQLAADASNLVGSGIRELFEKNLPVEMGSLFEGYSGDGVTVAGGIFASVLSYFGLGFAGVTIAGEVLSAAALGQNVLWILAILLIAFISCFISVLFFFVTLAIRQAGIIILIVLSPLAIICYALPNTKSFFDKWKKLFTGLLMVYPICGLLMGGGNYAGSMLLKLGQDNGGLGWFYTITAMLVTVIPFFFIPLILKSSMLAMGNLGMRISNFGRRIGGGIAGTVKGSQGYQELLKDRQIALNNARVRGIDGRLSEKSLGNRFRKLTGRSVRTELSARESRQRNRYLASSDKLMAERAMADANAQRGPMVYGDNRYNAIVDRYRSKNVDEAAAANEAAWENSGVASDYQQLEDIAYKSALRLRDNFDDDGARAEFLAAQKILESSDSGRERLKSALNHFEQDSAGKEVAANRAARWLANAGMNRNGSKLKHDSPTLAAQYGRYLKDASAGGGILAPGDIARDSKGRYFNDADLKARIGDFNPEQLSDFDDSDLERLYAGMLDGTLSDAETDQLIGLTQRAFANPNTAAKIKGKPGDLMHQIAGVGFSPEYWGKKNGTFNGLDYMSAGRSMAQATASDLAYYETQLNDNKITGAEKDDLMRVMRSAITGAVNDKDYLGMSAENAKRIDTMLKKYGGGIALTGFTGAQKKAYERLLSNELRIKHTNKK